MCVCARAASCLVRSVPATPYAFSALHANATPATRYTTVRPLPLITLHAVCGLRAASLPAAWKLRLRLRLRDALPSRTRICGATRHGAALPSAPEILSLCRRRLAMRCDAMRCSHMHRQFDTCIRIPCPLASPLLFSPLLSSASVSACVRLRLRSARQSRRVASRRVRRPPN